MKISLVIKISSANTNIFCFLSLGFLTSDKLLKYENMKEYIGKNKTCEGEVSLSVTMFHMTKLPVPGSPTDTQLEMTGAGHCLTEVKCKRQEVDLVLVGAPMLCRLWEQNGQQGSGGVDDRPASEETTQMSTSEFNSLHFGKDLSRNRKKEKQYRVWKHVGGWQRWSFGEHFYFPMPLNKVDESVFKSVSIHLTVVSENKCLNQLK